MDSSSKTAKHIMSKPRFTRSTCATLLIVAHWLTLASHHALAADTGAINVRVLDSESKLPIPARMHLKDQKGHRVVPKNVPHWGDHFAIDGEITLELKAGTYAFELECGPEYKFRDGEFTIKAGAEGSNDLVMERFFDMAKQGWYAGDVTAFRRRNDMALWMRIEGLHAVMSSGLEYKTAANDYNAKDDKSEPLAVESFLKHGASFSAPARLSEFAGGKMLTWYDRGSRKPDEPPAADALGLTTLETLASERGSFAAAASSSEWDIPIWLANKGLEGVVVANHLLTRDGTLKLEPTQKPRPAKQYAGAHANGLYAVDTYFTLLNAGARLVPLAGSGSGANESPLGYCRTYVYCAPKYTPEIWYANLRAGHVVITNGPLMTPKVNGQLPGHVFKSSAGKPLSLRAEMNLGTREKIEYVELIKDGKVAESIRLDKWAEANGKLPEVTFDHSGWMAIRVVTNHPGQLRFAMSGPFYVEIGNESAAKTKAVKAMLNWMEQRPKYDKIATEAYQEALKPAKSYWEGQLERARDE
jgi:hypothetical protein